MKRIKKTKFTISLIVALIAGIEFIILQIFIYFNILPPGGVNASLSMLLTCIAYFIISAAFTFTKHSRNAMWTAICAFIFLCIFLFYSVSIVDILTFIVLLVGLLHSMIILSDKIKNEEGTDK